MFILDRHVLTDKEESWKELKKKEKKKCPKTLSHTTRDTHSLRVEWKRGRNENNTRDPWWKKSIYFHVLFQCQWQWSLSLSVLTTAQNFTLMVPLCLVSNTKRIFFLSHLSLLRSKVQYHALSKNLQYDIDSIIKDRFSIPFLHTRLYPLSVVLCVTF